MLQQSIYTHIFHNDGRFFIYNSKNSLLAEITEDLYEYLYNRNYDSLPDSVVSELINKEVLCDDSEQFLYYSEELVKFNASAYNDTELGIVIVPTTNCNFDCPYCFEGKKQPHIMTEDVQDAIIDHISSNKNVSKIHLTWYGGEPLMAFNVMQNLYNKIKLIDSKTISSHTIITNGYLISEGVINFINYAKVRDIQITLDGNRSHHDSLRCLRVSHKPTYETILKNIQWILGKCPEVSLSIRVNINKENYKDFFEVYKYFQENLNSHKITVYPGFIREDTPDKCSLCYNSMPDEFKYHFYKELRNNGVNVNFLPEAVKKRGCMMHQLNSFIVGPRGELYKCWNDVNNDDKIIGYINNDLIKNRNLFYHMLTETHPFADSNCKNCLQFPICSGGCGWYRSRNITANGRFNICPIHKNLSILEDSLVRSLDKENIIYHQQIPVS